MPRGWRAQSNAVPLPLSRPWDEFKYSKEQSVIASLGLYIEEVGLAHVLEHLEGVCDEQASLFGDGCGEVFPKDKNLAGVWAYFAKRFREMHEFTMSYKPAPKQQ